MTQAAILPTRELELRIRALGLSWFNREELRMLDELLRRLNRLEHQNSVKSEVVTQDRLIASQ